MVGKKGSPSCKKGNICEGGGGGIKKIEEYIFVVIFKFREISVHALDSCRRPA